MSLQHWLIVAIVLILVFGPNRLGNIGKGLGEGLRELRKGLQGGTEPRPLDSASPDRPNPDTPQADGARSDKSASHKPKADPHT